MSDIPLDRLKRVTADWSVLELDGLADEIKQQAGSVAAMFETYNTAEDLEQEAMIWCATNAGQVRSLHAQGDSLLPVRIWSKLRDKVRTEASHQTETIGIHRLYENEG